MRIFKDKKQEWISKEGKSRKVLRSCVVREEVLFLGFRDVTVDLIVCIEV